MLTGNLCGLAQKKAGVILAVIGLAAVACQAKLITGSEGVVRLTGNDGANATGSYVVDVAYEMYDGTSASDPKGITPDFQIAIALHHVGGDGETPVLEFGRFFVFSPEPGPFYTGQYYVNPTNAGQFLVGPAGNEIDPFNGVAPHRTGTSSSVMGITNLSTINGQRERARWSFTTTSSDLADFQSGQISQMLVLTASPSKFTTPRDIIVEIDGTKTVRSISADATITLVPEPATGMLLLLSVAGLIRGRRH